MSDTATPANQPLSAISVKTFTDLRSAGLEPDAIHRLHQLRDRLSPFPHIEFFSDDQWCHLRFLKWRYDNGEYAEDMPPAAQARNESQTR
ncbi:MAG TPA: hypothetical protein VKZ96_01955 [Thermomicrobiales bacterium]|nr:hypothetical protein [Thermomicrobiales bacterium]